LEILLYHPSLAQTYADMILAEEPDLTLHPCSTEAEAGKHIAEAEILACHVGFPSHLLEEARRLQWIQVLGAGVDKFVLKDVVPEGVALTRVTGSFGAYISEYVLAHLLSVTQRISTVVQNQKERKWGEFVPDLLKDKVVGVAGLGQIGSDVASALLHVGCTVHGFDITAPTNPAIKWYAANDLDEFLAAPDFVVLCLPLNKHTYHIIGLPEFAQMKNSAYLVNVARGALVDEDALVKALNEGMIEGAILDVFEEEPLPTDSLLWDMQNVTVTAHLSGPADPNEAYDIFIRNIRRYRSSEPLINQVDLDRGF